MGAKLQFKRGDGPIVVGVGLLFAAAAWAVRLATRADQPDPDRWWTPVIFLGVSVVVIAALVAIQRLRPPSGVLAAAFPGLVLALIPMVVNFALGDLMTTEAVARQLANVVALPAASMLIYTWSRRQGGATGTDRPGVSSI